MISYETAVKLLNAGFPQYGIGYKGNIMIEKSPCCYAPTLSELMEACGDKFETLHNGSDWWAGIYNFHDEEWMDVMGKGETAEEAVANLYLAIHKPSN